MDNINEQDRRAIKRQRIIRRSLAHAMSVLDRKSAGIIEALDVLSKEDDYYPFTRRALALDQVRYEPEDVERLSTKDLKKQEDLKKELSQKSSIIVAHSISHYFKILYDEELSVQERQKAIFPLCLLIMTMATLNGGNVEDLMRKTYFNLSQNVPLAQLQKIYQYQLMARKLFLDEDDMTVIQQEYQEGKGIDWKKHGIEETSPGLDTIKQDLSIPLNKMHNSNDADKYHLLPGTVPMGTSAALRFQFKKLYNLKNYGRRTEKTVFSLCRLALVAGRITGKPLKELRYDTLKSCSRYLSLSYMAAVYHKQLAMRKPFLTKQVLEQLHRGQQIEM